MGRTRNLLLGGGLLVTLGTAGAQMRPGQPPTLSPQTPPAVQGQDVLEPFSVRYRAAGSPRIVLFWNVSFDAATRTPKVHVSVQSAEIAPVQTGNGATAVAGIGVRARTSGYLDPTGHGFDTLSAPTLAQLDSAFRNELLAARVRLLDRAATIRFMQAQRDRTGVDPKLIETDAVLGKADILLQVLLVRDAASPLDAGFKVSAIRVRTGAEIASLYTLALPDLPAPQGRYVATDRGFVWRQPPRPTPDAAQIGAELANEVMEELAPGLGAEERSPSSAKGR